MERNKQNFRVYTSMEKILDKYKEPPVYWENQDTLLCAYTQMINTGDEESALVIIDDSNNCCAQYCEFGYGIRCRIRECMWTCR
jgi:hypothetical protein